MKLQIKDSGAWRNVASFDKERSDAVLTTGAALLAALNRTGTSMRVTDGDCVLSYCEAPAYLWRMA